MSLSEMENLTLEVVERNESIRATGDDYMITQIVTRGEGGRVGRDMDANVSIWIDPIDFVRYSPEFQNGAHVVIPKTRSYSAEQIDPKVKHYSRLNFVDTSINYYCKCLVQGARTHYLRSRFEMCSCDWVTYYRILTFGTFPDFLSSRTFIY